MGFQISDKFLQVGDAQCRPCHQNKRLFDSESDRLEIIHGIGWRILKKVLALGKRIDCPNNELIAIGRCLCDSTNGNRAAGAANIFNDDSLAKYL
jgi:hypothetical protein